MAQLAIHGGAKTIKEPLPAYPQPANREEIEAATRVLLSGNLTAQRGHEVEEFDEAFAAYMGAGHSASCSNGTTALHLAYVAKGGFVAAISCCPKLWDVAAGAFIAETAGAVVTDWAGEKIFPIDMDAYDSRELKAAAANKKVHPEIVELLNH